ncbi:MAG: zinc ribbon domain-containing protein [candidate division WOR-3 bacterium]
MRPLQRLRHSLVSFPQKDIPLPFFNVFLTPLDYNIGVDTEEKKICPKCNYLGGEMDNICPYCGIELISKCPKCGARIKSAFAEYCYVCGLRFADAIRNGRHSNQRQSAHSAKQKKKGGDVKAKRGRQRDKERW